MNTMFPKSFIFGVADADLQVIGEKYTLKYENSLPTMWTATAQKASVVYNNDTPLEGINRYEKWEEDIEILKSLGVKHYRISISMSRLLNEDKTINKKAVAWYRTYFTALKKAGITIYATLYHWELPQFLHEKGGWANKETIDFLVTHARAVYENFNEFIEEYFIINEHVCIIFLSYYYGIHAPFEHDIKKSLQAGHNLLLAQGQAFAALKNLDKTLKVSTVYNCDPAYAKSVDENDLLAQKAAFEYNPLWFIDPVFLGKYPPHLTKVLKDYLPEITTKDMEIIQIGDKLHSLGINYYNGKTVSFDEKNYLQYTTVEPQFKVSTGLGWPVYLPPVYSQGLYDLLLQINARYQPFGLNKIYITENGTSWPNSMENGEINDNFRITYIKEHLKLLHKAILAGVPVEGYFLWTLMDNYEWQEGYKPESAFGIVAVDRKTLKRTPKKSFYWYRDVINNHAPHK